MEASSLLPLGTADVYNSDKPHCWRWKAFSEQGDVGHSSVNILFLPRTPVPFGDMSRTLYPVLKAPALKQCVIVNLFLGNNAIGDEGVTTLADSLTHARGLQELYLNDNEVSFLHVVWDL